MKIGIIGNMNNSYFSLARYLRDEGYDCELLIFTDEPDHFDPSCDTTTADYKAYCKKISWGDMGDFLKQDFSLVKKDLAAYDVLIGNGPAPAYVAKVGRQLDIFIPFGFDLYALPFVRLVHPVRQLAYIKAAAYQSRGINESRYILFDRTNKEFEKQLQKVKFKGKRFISPAPMFYYKDYDAAWMKAIRNDDFETRLQALRQANEFILVQTTRQVWKGSGDEWSNKGNSFLIEGYRQFVKENPGTKITLILFEYGVDVAKTKKLIGRLGIENKVVWFPKMARNALLRVVAISDLVVGELYYSWLSYGVALEALYMAKPFMHKRIDEEFSGDYPELYPMLHAHSAASVFAGLKTLVQDKAGLEEMGRKGQQWFLTYCVNRPLAIIKNIIEEKKGAVRA